MQSNVPIGPTTVAGWGTAIAAFILALAVYLTGGHTAEATTAVELAAGGLIAGVITQIARYLQANKQLTVAVATAERELALSRVQVEALVEQAVTNKLPEILRDLAGPKSVVGS